MGLLWLLSACTPAFATQGEMVVAEPAPLATDVPAAPRELMVPEGHVPTVVARAEGVQVYECRATAGVPLWTLLAPDAVLLDRDGQEVGTHAAGPTWESLDGSLVVGTVITSVVVDESAISWLLLEGAGHSGQPGVFSDVSYIQRLRTRGGMPPLDGCDVEHVGATFDREYSAVYVFFVPAAPVEPISGW